MAMVALASAAPQFQGDSSNAIILQEQRWAGLCFCVFLYYCIMSILNVFLCIFVPLYYISYMCFCVFFVFLTGRPPPLLPKMLAKDQRFEVIFLLGLKMVRTLCTIVHTMSINTQTTNTFMEHLEQFKNHHFEKC